MTRQAYKIPDKKLVIFWTPKAACTTLSTKICLNILDKKRADFASTPGGMRGWLRRSDYWVSGPDGMDLCMNQGYRSICLIRDPYDRLISAYINKFVRNKKRDLDTVESLEPFAKAFYQNVMRPKLSIDENAPYVGFSFREFVEAVCDRINARGSGEPRLDHHWNTQIPFLFGDAGFKYDEVFNLETADKFFTRLGELTGIPKKNNKMNATTYEATSEAPLQDTKSVELIKINGISKVQFKDPKILKLVEDAFEIDYSYFDETN